jgi:hypothetical protein
MLNFRSPWKERTREPVSPGKIHARESIHGKAIISDNRRAFTFVTRITIQNSGWAENEPY